MNSAKPLTAIKHFFQNTQNSRKCLYLLAEAVRFELTNGCPLPVFKTGAIDHSATLPEGFA